MQYHFFLWPYETIIDNIDSTSPVANNNSVIRMLSIIVSVAQIICNGWFSPFRSDLLIKQEEMKVFDSIEYIQGDADQQKKIHYTSINSMSSNVIFTYDK